ncbi:acyl-CoA synthetase [Microbacterium sp. NPDC088619]|uniref:acyl-CoA synthetase n=1 Tax=Microbacterium sp. NPDC088619 TaxID=3364196 RepID=UPI0037FA6676
MSAPARAFTVRHLQLLRALFAAAAAVMITFSPDHSAAVGLSVFSGFVLTTGLVMIVAAWLVYPAGQRWPSVVFALLSFAAGMTAGVPAWRTEDLFFVVVIAWSVTTGILELVVGLRARRAGEPNARDSITLGVFGLLLAVLLIAIPAGFVQPYAIDGAGAFELTGIILGVGMFGGYAAVVAVFLGIAGLTPKRADAVAEGRVTENDPAPAGHGGER